MPTLNLTTEKFADIAMIWLFDQIMNPEQVDNETLKEFIDDHRSKIKTPLMMYFLDADKDMRRKYKLIKGIFDGSDKAIQQIRIGPSDKIEQIKKGKQGIVKKILKKVLKKEELSTKEKSFLKELKNVDYEIPDEIIES